MMEKEIKNSFEIFNEQFTNIITAFTKYNLDEHSIIFIAKSTKHLMSFTQKILLKLLFKFFKTVNFLKNKINQDIIDINKIIEIIHEQLEISLNNIIAQNYNENQQEDIDSIVKYLTVLKKIIDNLSNLFLSVVKFQTGVIKEEEFRDKYRAFKSNIGYIKNELIYHN